LVLVVRHRKQQLGQALMTTSTLTKTKDDHGEDNGVDEEVNGAGVSHSPSQNTRQAKRKLDDVSAVSTSSLFEEEDENAPASYIPETLLLIVDLGVLSDQIQAPLQYAIPQGTSTEASSSSSGPSRAELRAEASKVKEKARNSLSSQSGNESDDTPKATSSRNKQAPAAHSLGLLMQPFLEQKERHHEQQLEAVRLVKARTMMEIINEKIKTVDELLENETDPEMKSKLEAQARKLRYEKLSVLDN
jgi:hypothetical protein